MLNLVSPPFNAHLSPRPRVKYITKVCTSVLLLAISCATFSKDANGYEPEFKLVNCPEGETVIVHHILQCGKVAVPHNYYGASNGFLDVMVHRLRPIRTRSNTPLIFISGGPGASFSTISDRVFLLSRLMPERELIFYELRGMVELQTYSPCHVPAYDDQIQLSGRFDDANGLHNKRIRRMQALRRDCTAKFLRNYAIPGEAFHIANLAHDVESIRTALNIEQWDVMAHSFGPIVALEALRLAPENTIRSMVLSAPALPFGIGHTHTIHSESYPVTASLLKLFAACERERACRKQYPQLKDRFLRTANQLMENPLTFSSEKTNRSEVIDAARFIDYAFLLMDRGRGMDTLPAFIELVEKADSKALANLFNLNVPEKASQRAADDPESAAKLPVLTTLSPPIHIPLRTAMECNGTHTVEHVLDKRVLNSEIYNLLVDFDGNGWTNSNDCERIVNRRNTKPTQFSVPEADVPILLLAGGMDPRTPADYAVWLSTQLPSATLLLDPQSDHSIGSFDTCVGLEAVRFLKQPHTFKTGKCAIDSKLHVAKRYPKEWVAELSNPWLIGRLPRYWFNKKNPFGASHHDAKYYTNMRAVPEFHPNNQSEEGIKNSVRNLLLATSKNPDIPSEHDTVFRQRIGEFTWTIARYYDADFNANSWIAWRRTYTSLIMGALTTTNPNSNQVLKKLFYPFLQSLKPCVNYGDRIGNLLLECQY